MRCRLSKLLPSIVDHQSWISSWLSKLLLSKEINLSLWTWLSPTNTNPGLPWGAKFQNSWVYMMFCGLVTECRGFQSKNGQRTIYTDSYRRLDRWCLQCLSILLSWASVWVSLHSTPPSLSGSPETTSSLNALIAAFPCCLLAACLSSLILATGTSSQNALSLFLVVAFVAFVALVTGSIIAYSWPLRWLFGARHDHK